MLASYQPGTTSQQPADWTEAVARYAGTAEEAKIVQYTGQVFDVLRSGATETTDLGDTVTLAAQADAQPDRAGLEAAGALEPGIDELECPDTIECEAIEALYVLTDTTEPIDPTDYVNYDLADRENDVSIDYLVVHDTECDYEVCVELIQTPDRFVSWQYTIRSADGHVAQHVATHNVAAHAGNWYINMHSIGLEHEGYAAGQGLWYTDALYRSSAELGEVPRCEVRLRARPSPRRRPRGVPVGQLQVGPGPVLGLGALHEAPRRTDPRPTGRAAGRSSR